MDRAILFQFYLLEIPALHTVDLPALRAIPFPQFLLVNGQVAVTAADLLPLPPYEDQFLMSALCHELEDTGLTLETQTEILFPHPAVTTRNDPDNARERSSFPSIRAIIYPKSRICPVSFSLD